jgi:hypothetical protein
LSAKGSIDERTLTATLVFNADMGNYSSALGAAERLSNGNYYFTSGREPHESIEVLPDGTQVYVLQLGTTLYRSFRVRTLYAGVNDHVHDGGGAPRPAAHHGVDGLWAAVGAALPSSPDPLIRPTAPFASMSLPAPLPLLTRNPPISIEPASQDWPAVAAAARDAWHASLRKPLWHDPLGDDLAGS